MEIIWLRETNPDQMSYRRGAVAGTQNPPVIEKEQYIPSYCNSDHFCNCGLPKVNTCDVCSSEMFTLVKSSCMKGKLEEELTVLVPSIKTKKSVQTVFKKHDGSTPENRKKMPLNR